jgi:peptidoglycan/xylan/chitin deacetylase (PgdA/CDA1 family)
VSRVWLPLLLVCCTRGKPAVPILGYHSVGTVADEYTVPQAAFEQQLDWLKAEGFETLSIHDFLEGVPGRGRAVVLTFDDGKEDAVRIVLPALQKRGMRGSFFLITSFVGQPGYVSWEDARRLAAAGMEIGSHTVDHQRLADLPDDRVRDELAQSKRMLEEKLGRPVEALAYPYNSMRARTAQLAQEANYRAALAGVVHGNDRTFSLYRFSVTGTTTLEELRTASLR